MALPPVLQGDITDPKFGPPGFGTSTTPTVLIEGRPVLTIGSPVSVHGNPSNPRAPGFNPPCAASVILSGATRVLVNGRPMAYIGSMCTCGLHQMALVGAATVKVGL
jgi:uncharacterized Zn-binding protein involved in type VI secretion